MVKLPAIVAGLLLATTFNAAAQREGGNYMGGFGGTVLGGTSKCEAAKWSAAGGERALYGELCKPRPQSRKPRFNTPRR
jgi:hypothetical protein